MQVLFLGLSEKIFGSLSLWLLLRTLFNLLSHLFKLSIKMVFVFPFKMQDHTRRGQPSCRKIRPNVCEARTACTPLLCPKCPILTWKGVQRFPMLIVHLAIVCACLSHDYESAGVLTGWECVLEPFRKLLVKF